MDTLRRAGVEATAVDIDPTRPAVGRRLGHRVLYGDAADPRLLDQVGSVGTRVVVVAVDRFGSVAVKRVRGVGLWRRSASYLPSRLRGAIAKSPFWRSWQQWLQQPRHMDGFAPRAIGDLVAAAGPVGHHDGIRLPAQGRQ